MDHSKTVLLTGVSGFLGTHTAIQLLEKGYTVIGTLRDMSRKEDIRTLLAKHTTHTKQLQFVKANLSDPIEVWNELMKGVDYVQHIASPFPRVLPKREEDLIIPAKRGALNVLKAAATNGVKRVVLTSSTGSVLYGKTKEELQHTFTEEDWTNVQNKKDTTPYFRSKTIAERAAWDFIKNNPSETELATVCPGAILGPVLEKDFGTSANIIVKTLDGSTPAIPKIGFDMVDVRSVADLLIKAMESEKAANERFVATAGYMSFKEVAAMLKKAYPNRKIPSTELPNFAVRLFAMLEASLKPVLVDLGVQRKLRATKAQELLGWKPKSLQEAVLSCAQSVLELGIVK
jgi:dihydroflavonol-4-reductase